MPVIITTRPASVAVSPSETRNFPAAWKGEVSNEIAEALEAEGAATVLRAAPPLPAKKAKEPRKPKGAEPAAPSLLDTPAGGHDVGSSDEPGLVEGSGSDVAAEGDGGEGKPS